MVLSPMTELEAVNDMLESIGQAPVNMLENTGIQDVNIARNVLHSTSRAVQARGWWFNRERKYSLPADVNGEVIVPQEVLSIDPSDRTQNFVQRGQRLYDIEHQTFAISKPVEVDMVIFVAFEELPQTARDYIATKAARRFQAKAVGSQVLHQYTQEDEGEAFLSFTRENLRNRNSNMLSGSKSVQRFSYNPHRLQR